MAEESVAATGTAVAGAAAESSGAPPAAAVPPDVLRRSLSYSVKDALAWAIMTGAGTNYVTPFIVLRGWGLIALAFFFALPTLFGALVQGPAADLTDRLRSRNRVIVPTAVIQGLGWLPICVAVFLPAGACYWTMLAAYVVHVGLTNFGNPAWHSLMGELVPPERRGRYFGGRNALAYGLVGAAFYLSGVWVSFCDAHPGLALFGLSSRNTGFLMLFAVAGLARLRSAWYLNHVYEPSYRPHHSDRFTLLEFVRRAPRAQFGRFAFYSLGLNIGFGLVTPFLGWYLLEQLRFTPAQFAAVMALTLVGGLISNPLCGRLSDRFGTKHVLGASGIGLIFMPVLLLMGQSIWWLAVALLYEGVMYNAFLMTSGNYVYDVVTTPKRARCAAYLALFVAVGGFIGAVGGALIGQYVPRPVNVAGVSLTAPFTLMLLASVGVRLLTNVALLGTFHEFRLRRE